MSDTWSSTRPDKLAAATIGKPFSQYTEAEHAASLGANFANFFQFTQFVRRVDVVVAGVIESPIHPVETHAWLGALPSVGHTAEISDIIAAILFRESASFATGDILHVDGSQSAGHWQRCEQTASRWPQRK